jgi:dolichol-phosphate mannosyltransferase
MKAKQVKSSVTFIAPALNEEVGIEGTAATIRDATETVSPSDYEIVLVNDGSTDRTGELMKQLAREDNRIRVIENSSNLGLGASFMRGVAVARCDYVMLVAGDNVASADSLAATIEHLGEADMILPYIANPNVRPLLRRIGSRAFTMVINCLFGLRIPYYNGVVPRRDLLREITVATYGYGFGAEIVVKLIRAGHSYVTVGVRHNSAPDNNSSALQLRNLLKVLRAIMNLTVEMRRSATPTTTGSGVGPDSRRDL